MYKKNPPANFWILPDGILYSLIPLIIGAILAIWIKFYALIFLLPIFFILFFFRNPNRKINVTDDQLLSPADGKVLSITQIENDEFIGGKAVNISIFLSLFNTHINRSPMKGIVKKQVYREGAMLPAFKSHASEINERNTVGLEADDGYKIIVNQITGFIARRIVWWSGVDYKLEAGEKFGYIKFGSCTQLIVPLGTKILVSEGQKVKAGITVMGIKN